MGLSPTSKTIKELDSWQIGLIYETAMNYPVEGLRRAFFENKKSVSNFDDEDLLDAGYSPEEISRIKGKR